MSPMLVTLSGILIEDKFVQLKKARSPILVTEEGIMVFWQPTNNLFDEVIIIALHESRES
jgi:hypothetical protein